MQKQKKKQKFYSERNYETWMYIKDDIQLKKRLHNFKEWEIWWCSVGENVGTEINGKGSHFVRPIIIFKKFDRLSFIAIPLTTKDHTDRYPDWYTYFQFKNKNEYAVINQLSYCSAFRLLRKIGELDSEDINKINSSFRSLYLKNTPSVEGCGGKIPNCILIIHRIIGKIKLN